MKSSFKHEHVSTSTTINDRVINGCFLQKETTKGLIHLKAFQVESDSVSLLVTYQINVEIRHENLDGHEIMFTLERPKPALELEYNIPKQFLVSQETCFDHVMIVLSELHLLPSIQERLVNYISTECVNFSNRYGGGGGGFKVEVNVKVNVERWVRIGNCNKESCRIRARNLATLLTAVDCPICLTELGSEVFRGNMGKLSPKASFSEIHDKLGTTLWSCWWILRKINTFSDAIYIPNHSYMVGMQQHATWEELYDGHTVNQIHRQTSPE